MILGVSFDDGNDFDGAVGETLRTLADDLVSTHMVDTKRVGNKGRDRRAGVLFYPRTKKKKLSISHKQN
jgi:hypothetical protein